MLPEAKFPFALPIETFLKNHESNERKMEAKGVKPEDVDDEDPRFVFKQNAKSQGLITLPEFNFRHVLYKMTEMNLSSEGLIYSYTKCAVFLGLKDEEHVGVTVLLSKKWMMVTTIEQPYMVASDGNPCYLDGVAYAGLVQLQEVEKVWPETVGETAKQKTVFESMEKQGQAF